MGGFLIYGNFVTSILIRVCPQTRLPSFCPMMTSSSDCTNSKRSVPTLNTLKSISKTLKELALAAEENSALRSDLENAKQFISERDKGEGNGEMDLVERRALDVQRRLEEAQEELLMLEHQREDDKIRIDVSIREAEEWRMVRF